MESKIYTEFNNQLQIMDTYIYITPEKQTELGWGGAQLDKFNLYGALGAFGVSLSFAIT